MKICKVFQDYEERISQYSSDFKELDSLVGVHDAIPGNHIYTKEQVCYDYESFSNIGYLLPDTVYYFYDGKYKYSPKVVEYINKHHKNQVIWVEHDA